MVDQEVAPKNTLQKEQFSRAPARHLWKTLDTKRIRKIPLKPGRRKER